MRHLKIFRNQIIIRYLIKDYLMIKVWIINKRSKFHLINPKKHFRLAKKTTLNLNFLSNKQKVLCNILEDCTMFSRKSLKIKMVWMKAKALRKFKMTRNCVNLNWISNLWHFYNNCCMNSSKNCRILVHKSYRMDHQRRMNSRASRIIW